MLANGRHPVYLKTVDPDRQAITLDSSSSSPATPPPRLPVAADTPITVNVLAAQTTGSATKDVSVTLAKLASYFPNSGTPPFWITVEQGQVTKIAQQYLP